MAVLFIKNMVCDRCIMVVEDEIKKLGLAIKSIELGRVELVNEISPVQKDEIEEKLKSFGFEIIDDKNEKLAGQIKNIIIDLVHNKYDGEKKLNHSSYLSKMTGRDYNYLSTLFSETEGTTIEKYFILQKIEKVKELLSYNELNLSEIAFQLNYSSVQHLSSQFKKVTGLTPGEFKLEIKRKALDKI